MPHVLHHHVPPSLHLSETGEYTPPGSPTGVPALPGELVGEESLSGKTKPGRGALQARRAAPRGVFLGALTGAL